MLWSNWFTFGLEIELDYMVTFLLRQMLGVILFTCSLATNGGRYFFEQLGLENLA